MNSVASSFNFQSFLALPNAYLILFSKLSIRKIIKSINKIGLEILLGFLHQSSKSQVKRYPGK